MIQLLAHKLRRRERGAIALMTLGFMVAAGLGMLVLLWGLARSTGAFNALYAANQSAAYAAVSATRSGREVPAGQQLKLACVPGPIDSTDCVGGDSLSAAETVMDAALRPGVPGSFGLDYGQNVNFTDQTYTYGGTPLVKYYEVPFSTGSARRLPGGTCNPSPGSDIQRLPPPPGSGIPNGDITCWRVHEFGVSFPPQYVTGVVSRAVASYPVFPGCAGAAWCPTVNLQVVAAASQDQPLAPSEYGDYYHYGAHRPPPRDTDSDGVIDGLDQCPTVPGPASNQGCPITPPPPDSDSDGIIDSADACPNQAGPPENNGCPVPAADETFGVYRYDCPPAGVRNNCDDSWLEPGGSSPLFRAWSYQAAGTVKVYQYWSSQESDSYYTTDSNFQVPGYSLYDPNPYFYAYPRLVPGTSPLYNGWNDAERDHAWWWDCPTLNYFGYDQCYPSDPLFYVERLG